MRIFLFGQRFSTNFLWLVSGFFFYFTIRSCTCCDGVVVNTENQSEKESGRHFVFQVRLASSSRRHLEIHSELLIGPSSSNGNRFLLFFLLLFSAELRLWAHQVGGKRKVCVHFPAVFHRDRKLSGRQWLPPGNGQLRRFSFFFFHYLPPHSTAPYSAAGGSSVKPV